MKTKHLQEHGIGLQNLYSGVRSSPAPPATSLQNTELNALPADHAGSSFFPALRRFDRTKTGPDTSTLREYRLTGEYLMLALVHLMRRRPAMIDSILAGPEQARFEVMS